MKKTKTLLGFLAFCVGTVNASEVGEGVLSAPEFSNRVIVEFRSDRLSLLPFKAERDKIKHLIAGVSFLGLKVLFPLSRSWVIEAPLAKNSGDIDSLLSRIRSLPSVRSASADLVLKLNGESTFDDPNWDSLINFYRHGPENFFNGEAIYSPAYLETSLFAGKLDMSRTTVAVLDSGVLSGSREFDSSIYLEGRTFLPGNYKDGSSEVVPIGDFSHGTAVAGILGAKANNGVQLAGVASGANLRMMRVFKGVTARTSDVLLASLYAANLHNSVETGIPDNPSPASVINISASSNPRDLCTPEYAEPFERITNSGVIVVSSAGNESVSLLGVPANCPSVISVGSANSKGFRSSYSNVSPLLNTSTFGGDGDFKNLIPLIGTRGGKSDEIKKGQGTSFSAPLVSATIAISKAINPSLGYTEVLSAISKTGTPFSPNDPVCGKGECGNLFDPRAYLLATTGVDVVSSEVSEVPYPGFVTFRPETGSLGVVESAELTYRAGDSARSKVVLDEKGLYVKLVDDGQYQVDFITNRSTAESPDFMSFSFIAEKRGTAYAIGEIVEATGASPPLPIKKSASQTTLRPTEALPPQDFKEKGGGGAMSWPFLLLLLAFFQQRRRAS